MIAAAYGGATGNWQPTQMLVVLGQLSAAAQVSACRKICQDMDHAGQRLEVFAGLLTAIERAAPGFQSPLLQHICVRITGGESDRSASAAISELTRIIAWRDSAQQPDYAYWHRAALANALRAGAADMAPETWRAYWRVAGCGR